MSKSKLQDLKIRITELKTTPEEPSNSFERIKAATGGSLKRKEVHNIGTYYIHLWQQRLPASCSHL